MLYEYLLYSFNSYDVVKRQFLQESYSIFTYFFLVQNVKNSKQFVFI